MDKISFVTEDGNTEEFYIEEQTVIAGTSYLLVSDSDGDEANAYILRDTSDPDSPDACYEMVEDEQELDAVYKVFQTLMEDADLV